VEPSPLTAVSYWPLVPVLGDNDDYCGAVSGINNLQGK
jgi:hypothetical protein